MAIKLVPLSDVTVTTAGTRVQVGTAIPVSTVIFCAKKANTGNVYVGDSTVAAGKGVELEPGESIALTGDMSGRVAEEFVLNDFWADAATSGDKVAVSYVTRR